MNTWKLTIKPDSTKGYDAFSLCRSKSLIGVGWAGAYKEKQASNINEAKLLVKAEYKKWPYQIKYLLEDVVEDDHVWIHQNGNYYLCKVEDEKRYFGKEIDDDFLYYDLGHARKVKWVNVPEIYVSGSVQRGTIAQRMIQRIWITEQEKRFHNILFDNLSRDPDWKPKIDESKLSRLILNIDIGQLFSLMSPDDVEDVVSAYLQSKGWVLIKSTCFRSKPVFEFSLLNRVNKVCQVQVKSGKHPDPLRLSNYRKFVTDKSIVFLFSTHSNPYPGEAIDGVLSIAHNDIFRWLINNIWSLTTPLKLRLWIFLNEIGG